MALRRGLAEARPRFLEVWVCLQPDPSTPRQTENVSALDFLSVSAATDDKGFHPVARSCVERRFRDAGATFEERAGWLVPVALPGEQNRRASVGIADLSHLAKAELRPAPEAIAGDAVLYRISPRRALVLGSAESVALATSSGATTIDVTGSLGILAIVGPEASTVIRRLTHLHDFPKGGEVAHVTAHVLPANDGYWLVFAQELGDYLYEVVVDRAAALGGGPIGVDAL